MMNFDNIYDSVWSAMLILGVITYIFYRYCHGKIYEITRIILTILLPIILFFRRSLINDFDIIFEEDIYLIAAIIILFFLIPTTFNLFKSKKKLSFFKGLFSLSVLIHLVFSVICYYIFVNDTSSFKSIVTTNEITHTQNVTKKYSNQINNLTLINSYLKVCQTLMSFSKPEIIKTYSDISSSKAKIIFHKSNNIYMSVEEYGTPETGVTNYLTLYSDDEYQHEIQGSSLAARIIALGSKMLKDQSRKLSKQDCIYLKRELEKYLSQNQNEINKIKKKYKEHMKSNNSICIIDFMIYSVNITSQMGNGIIVPNNNLAKILSYILSVVNIYLLLVGGYYYVNTIKEETLKSNELKSLPRTTIDIQIGPKGGRFYINEKGRKIYI